MKQFVIILLISVNLIISSKAARAQIAPNISWDKTFGGNGFDELFFIQQTSDGGYILGGHSNSDISGDKSQNSKGDEDFWVLKLNAAGTKVWDRTIGGSLGDYLYVVHQTTDGGYILGGYSNSGISGNKTQVNKGATDYWVVKLDSIGNINWDKDFGGNGFDGLNSLQQTSDGGYILGGASTSPALGDKTQPSQGGTDYWVIKLDAYGNKLWDKTFGGNDLDDLYFIQQTSDGGFILGGSSQSILSGDKSQPNNGVYDYWVVKLDVYGNIQWDKTFGGLLYDYLTSIHQTSDGGYILGGFSNSPVSGNKSGALLGGNDYWVVKLDASGNKTWDKTFGGSGADALSSLSEILGGGYILGGRSDSGVGNDKSQASQGGNDYWVIKIDSNGNRLWDKTIGGNSSESLNFIQQTTDGGYILAGSSWSGISGDKTQPSRYEDYWLVKLAPDVLSIKEPETNLNLTIYPNPNQGKFNLQLSNLTNPKAEVTVSDLLGRVVLKQEFKVTQGSISGELTLPKSKGIYLLQLKTGDQFLTRKVAVE